MKKLFLILQLFFITSAVQSADTNNWSFVRVVVDSKNKAQTLFIGRHLTDGTFKKPIIHPAITAVAVGGAVYITYMNKWNELLAAVERKAFLLGHKYPGGDFFSSGSSDERVCVGYVAWNLLLSSAVGAGTFKIIKCLGKQ